MWRQVRHTLAILMLALLVGSAAAIAQEPRPGEAGKFDQAQCLREAERAGRNLLDQFAKAVRESEAAKELEAASRKARELLRDACAAAGVLASEEARIAAQKMAERARGAARRMMDAVIIAMRDMRGALEEFYSALPDEQKRKLDRFMRPLEPNEPRPKSQRTPLLPHEEWL